MSLDSILAELFRAADDQPGRPFIVRLDRGLCLAVKRDPEAHAYTLGLGRRKPAVPSETELQTVLKRIPYPLSGGYQTSREETVNINWLELQIQVKTVQLQLI